MLGRDKTKLDIRKYGWKIGAVGGSYVPEIILSP